MRRDGTPLPFQVTMRRFGRKLDVDELRRGLPLTPFFFDCLMVDAQELIDDPLGRRADVRFARVKRYRDDKTAAEADTIETVWAIHQLGGTVLAEIWPTRCSTGRLSSIREPTAPFV